MNNAELTREEGFVEPTCEKIAGLGPGCFVQVRGDTGCYWVEITDKFAGRFRGAVHPELESPCCQSRPNLGPTAEFTGENISALGCDRYCFC